MGIFISAYIKKENRMKKNKFKKILSFFLAFMEHIAFLF